MMTKKRALALILALMMALALFACGSTDEAYDTSEADASALTEESATTETTTETTNETTGERSSAERREPRVTPIGNGEDTVTVMVYMCGSDLESDGGAATADINEMLYADLSDQVNVVIETGGASAWQNSLIDADTNQPNTFHTKNPVPFLLVSEKFKNKKLRDGGNLGNVAPTILDILGVEKPRLMDEESLLK